MTPDSPLPCCYPLPNGRLCQEPVGHDPRHHETAAEALRWGRINLREKAASR